MERKTKIIIPYLILAAVIIFQIINTCIWLTMDQSYIKLDAWGHYRYSLEVYGALKDLLHLKIGSFLNVITESLNWYGILVGFMVAPFYFIFGSSQDAAVMISSAIFLTILVFSTYAIGKRLFSSLAGLLAVFILTFCPIVFNHLRVYMLDLPLTSLVTLSLYFLLACDGFRNRKISSLFAISMMLGTLIKLNYLAFMAGPLALALYRAYKQKTPASAGALAKAGYLIATAVCLSAGFYLVKSKDVLQHVYSTSYMWLFRNFQFTPFAFLKWKLSWLIYYLQETINQGISFLFFAAFIIGLVNFIKLKIRDRWLLYLVIFLPLLAQISFFSIYPGCMVRYNLPFLPVISVISAIGLLRLKPRVIKLIFISVLVPLAVVQFFAVSYGIDFLPARIGFDFNIKELGSFNLAIFKQELDINPFLKDKTSHPSHADWKSAEVLKAIIDSDVSGERIKVVSLSNIPELIEAMDYRILIDRLPIYLTPVFSVSVEDYLQKSYLPLALACQSADYIITSDNYSSVWEEALHSSKTASEKIENARKLFYDNMDRFRLLKKILLPDTSNLFVYKNIYKNQLKNMEQIRRGDIRLIFDSGKIRIFYKDNEITKGLGLYTSLFSLEHWRDSREAAWVVTKSGETTLVATGRWYFIPVSQTWRIELGEGNVIRWDVQSAADDAIKIEIEDYKLMLSDKYKEWFGSDGKTGKFDGYFEKDVWKKFWEGDIKKEPGVRSIDIVDIRLPSVRFDASRMSSECFTSIENSDQLFSGRVIGCFKKNTGRNGLFLPQRDKSFSAQISID